MHFYGHNHALLWSLTLCEHQPIGSCYLLPDAAAHWSCSLSFTLETLFSAFSPLSLIFTRSQSMAQVKLCHIYWPQRPVKAIFRNAFVFDRTICQMHRRCRMLFSLSLCWCWWIGIGLAVRKIRWEEKVRGLSCDLTFFKSQTNTTYLNWQHKNN